MMINDVDVLVRPYLSNDLDIWDRFVTDSRNGTFLHMRAYLEYHVNRFPDTSLMIYIKDRLVALLPATVLGGMLYSHNGLTYGGLVIGRDFHASAAIPVFQAIANWGLRLGLSALIYKPVPHIYHRMPAEEDLYALFRLGGRLVRRDLSTTLLLSDRYAYSKGRKSAVAKAARNSVKVQVTEDFEGFMQIEKEHLESKHGVSPVHTSFELKLLASRFPENIKLIGAYKNQNILGGVLTYTTGTVCHAQYIGASMEGKEIGALDACIDNILNSVTSNIRWFDFGISTTNEGRYLDEALLKNKESWGGRSVVYDQYKLDLTGDIRAVI